jgi:hypothetical protein
MKKDVVYVLYVFLGSWKPSWLADDGGRQRALIDLEHLGVMLVGKFWL